MTEHLPDPLVPAEVDLRDFVFMPLDVRRLLTSTTWIKAKKDPRIGYAAICLWAESWHQVPAASLPDDDEVLAELARCDEREWKRIRERVLAGFVRCSDGRLYHPTVAEKALESWDRKTAKRDNHESRDTRQQRWRERCKQLAAEIRARGVAVPKGASLSTLERLLATSRVDAVVDGGASTVDAGEIGRTGTETETETSSSEPIGSGAAVASPPPATSDPEAVKPADVIFGRGIPLLTSAGVSDRNARSMLGLMRKQHGDPAVVDALQRCADEAPLEPVAWLQKALKVRPDGGARVSGRDAARAAKAAQAEAEFLGYGPGRTIDMEP